jgi:uncharacterized protein YjbJ (UPF0337 family)
MPGSAADVRNGRIVDPYLSGPAEETRRIMGTEDVAAGKAKQVKGKVNDVVGAARGDTGQQIKGKAQKVAGKVQEAVGKASSKSDER